MTAPKKTKTTHASTPTTIPTAAPTAAETPPPHPTDLTTAVALATTLLGKITAILPFDDPSAKEAKAAVLGNRVPNAAMTIAAKVIEANPARFPDLDPTEARAAVEYEQALAPLLTEIEQLQQRTAKTLQNRRAKGAVQTLALYQMLKGLSRVPMSKATLVQHKQLAKLLKTTTKHRATSVTQKELDTAAKEMRASKKAASKAAKAAAANAEAQVAAATEVAVTGANAAPAASPPPPATPAVTPSH